MMFDNIFNDKAIKELAGIIAEQEANRTAKEVLKEMDIKSIGLSEKLKDGINKVFKNEKEELEMTARELIEKMEIENLEKGLFYLGQYTGKGNHFLSFPDAEVEEIDEVDFAEYYERN